MTLAYGLRSPGEMLAKAKRELNALEDALWIQDETAIGDALFDVSVALAGVRDWLRRHRSDSFQPPDIDVFVNANRALNSLREPRSGNERGTVLDHAREAVAAWERCFARYGTRLVYDAAIDQASSVSPLAGR